jgi:serine/threonine protein phosphatase PrpC
MACDGVWDMMSDQLAVDAVAACANPVLSATTLRDRAFLSGSTDNISVVIVYFDPSLADHQHHEQAGS